MNQSPEDIADHRVEATLPCFKEESAIPNVVAEFRNFNSLCRESFRV